MFLLLLVACSGIRTPTFYCGKDICSSDRICLHWDPADSGMVFPDSTYGCVTAPAACNGVPTCECAGDMCESDCNLDNGGLSCFGPEPER
jgi:hypothetical protein